MIKILFILSFLLLPLLLKAMPIDSIRLIEAEKVVVRSSNKETNVGWSTPNAITVLSPFQINQKNIKGIKDLTSVVPNFFIPDYGAKLTTPIYLRGVGARSSGQSIGLYVDNIPYMNKSTFDFELMDIARIEVLRGPQGTLYGRNAMGGIVNVYTISPFDYQGTRVNIGSGNYGVLNAKASHYVKLSDKVAFSIGGYFEEEDGYFYNQDRKEYADASTSSGARFKLEWNITEQLKAIVASAYDYTNQNGFPYGAYDVEKDVINDVDYNDSGAYLRNMSNNSLRFEYRNEKVLITSNTGYQWLKDELNMDQDFSPLSIFTLNQNQRQNSYNQEFTIKSTTNKNYQWSAGMFGFYNDLSTGSLVGFGEDGVKNVLEKGMNSNPLMPVKLTVLNEEAFNPGNFDTPSWGVAAFHQSTFNNLLIDGLSLTIGIRLDYEVQKLYYDTDMSLNVLVENKPLPAKPILPPTGIKIEQSKVLEGNEQQDFINVLPRLTLKYECTPNIMTYMSVAKGYKTGGYNIQMFSEVMQDSLQITLMDAVIGSLSGGGGHSRDTKQRPPTTETDKPKHSLNDVVSYSPETAYSYEIGSRGNFGEGLLSYDLALFFMRTNDLQLTQFVDGGSGRIITNAGKGDSYGVELALNSNPLEPLNLDVSYGFTHSTFTDYKLGTDKEGNMVDYSGHFVPYVPMHTFSVGANYTFKTKSWVEYITLGMNYNGAGKIYWTEANNISQSFYGTLNASVVFRSSWMKIELWANNITNKQYGAFYFESFGNEFLQRGRPFTFGMNLGFTI